MKRFVYLLACLFFAAVALGQNISIEPIAPVCVNATVKPKVNDPDGCIDIANTIIEWSFEGGTANKTDKIDPTVTYSVANTYKIVLKLTNLKCGNQPVTIEQEVIVQNKPEIIFNDLFLKACVGKDTAFLLQSTIPDATFAWSILRGREIGAPEEGTGNLIKFIPTTNKEYDPKTVDIILSSPACGKGGKKDKQSINIIVKRDAPTNYNISGDQVICWNGKVEPIIGELPENAYEPEYLWEASPDQSTWIALPNSNTKDYTPTGSSQPTYFRRKLVSEPCEIVSNTVMIKVLGATAVETLEDKVLCAGPTPKIAFNGAPGATYKWENNNPDIGLGANGTGNINSFVAANIQNPKAPETAQIKVTPTTTENGTTCSGATATFQIIVLPTVNLNLIQDITECSGATIQSFIPAHDGGSHPGSSVTFSWTVAGSGIALQDGSGAAIPDFKTSNTTTTDAVATITITPTYTFNGRSCTGTQASYTITVRPGIPSANAGADDAICPGNEYTMKAALPPGTTGNWTQVQGPNTATITDATVPTTSVSGLQPGTYEFEWTITGTGACGVSSDRVIIQVNDVIANSIDGAAQTSCNGGPVTIAGQPATGGDGTNYTYQWQESGDKGTTWTTLGGATAQDLTYTPTAPALVRRVVQSGTCDAISNSVAVGFVGRLTSNTINVDQTVCAHTAPAPLIGSVPKGSNEPPVYQWQQSSDNGATWQDVAGATGKDYSPDPLVEAIQFRRAAGFAACGAPTHFSNVVAISIAPAPEAAYTFADSAACAPFNLASANLAAQNAPGNGGYEWYANETFIGSGAAFPGYTISAAADTVRIKLRVLSANGCGMDSTEQVFYTYDAPVAGFVTSGTSGCAPVVATFTANQQSAGFTYVWDLGNGQSANGPEASARYAASGNHNVQLTVASPDGCTGVAVQNIAIQAYAAPEPAISAPEASCAGQEVSFSHTNGAGTSVASSQWTLWDGTVKTGNNISYSFAQPGTYALRLTATTPEGCNNTAEHTITINGLPAVSAGADVSICRGASAGLRATGAATYAWLPQPGLSCTACPNPEAAPLSTVAYVVQGTTAAGCSASDTVLVTVAQPINVEAAASEDAVCTGTAVQLSATGANAYSWQPAAGLGNSTIANPVATPGATTTYSVVGYDEAGCFTDTAAVTVAVGTPPTIYIGADLTVASGTTVTLTPTVQGDAVQNWLWQTAPGLSCTTCPQPKVLVGNEAVYMVQGTTAYGCTAIDSIRIKVLAESAVLQMPSAFTPNGDGRNDRLAVRGQSIAQVKSFRVFNRWGNVVFQRTNFAPNDTANSWDGKVAGRSGGTEAYVYIVEVVSQNGKTATFKGTVTAVY